MQKKLQPSCSSESVINYLITTSISINIIIATLGTMNLVTEAFMNPNKIKEIYVFSYSFYSWISASLHKMSRDCTFLVTRIIFYSMHMSIHWYSQYMSSILQVQLVRSIILLYLSWYIWALIIVASLVKDSFVCIATKVRAVNRLWNQPVGE